MASHTIFFCWTLSLLLMSMGAKGVDFSGSEGSLNIFEGVDPTGNNVIAEDSTEHSIPEINKDTHMRGSDIVQRPSWNRNARRDPVYLWKLPIPLKFSKKLSLRARTTIMEGIREFEKLTCIRFVNHTTEEDFIHIKPLDGCWSSVGKIGGEQDLSLGSGCESMPTVIHEIMHALGFYHEQSRADRDLYLRIMLDNIKKDNAYNFDKLKYTKSDDHRVPYDYYSVMHYGGNAFAKEYGLTTIQTRYSEFQSVIGQRHGFSEGDVTKINRHYSCSDTSRFSYVCDFEDPDICGYVIKTYGWTRQPAVMTSDQANPKSDATFGQNGRGHFMVFSSFLLNNETMWSPYYISKDDKQCLQFSFYVDQTANSYTQIRVSYAKFNTTTGEINSNEITDEGMVSNYVPRTWNIYRRTIQAPSDYKLGLFATSGSQLDVIAIDDVSITDGACDTSYFTIHDMSSVWGKYAKGSGFYSPVMYTDDGYSFVLSVYPNGDFQANEGFMTLFLHLTHNYYVDTLSWPFHNRVIRIAMMDPQTDVTKQSNRFLYLEAKAEGGKAWEKPEKGTINQGITAGSYNTFSVAKAKSVYVKNNALTFSVKVTTANQLRELLPDDTANEIQTTTSTAFSSSTSTTTTVRMTQPPTTSSGSGLSSSIFCGSTLLFVVVSKFVIT